MNRIQEEVWVPVPGYEQFYEVSNFGRIKSLPREIRCKNGTCYIKPGRIRKPVLNKGNGYNMLFLTDGIVKKCMYVHRIVAVAFCENPENFDFVNHKNENKTDNRSENLEWCTKEYNNNYNGKSQRCNKKVSQLSLDGFFVASYMSGREACKATGIQYKNISAVCRGKRKSAGGYIWRFE